MRCRRQLTICWPPAGINPLTAMLMLALAGCRKTPRADRGIVLLRQSAGAWALAMGARSVSGIIRSPQHRAREQAGIIRSSIPTGR